MTPTTTAEGFTQHTALSTRHSALFSVVDRATLHGITPITSPAATHFALAPDEKGLYVSNWKANTVSVIDPHTTTIVKRIPVGKRPMTPIATPDRLYVANIKSSTISVIERQQHTVVQTIQVDGSPQHMALAGHFLYVTNPPRQNVQVIDVRTNALVAAIFTGPSPQQIAPRYVP